MRLALRRIDPGSGWGNVGEGIERALNRLGVETVGHEDPAPALLHILPPHFYAGRHKGSVPWLFTMWETDTMPDGLLQGLDNFAGIIVPTDKDHALFSAVHPNVHKVNLGVDHQFWTPQPRVWDGGPFRLAYTAHSPHRKGGDVAEKAGRLLAKRGYDVELVPATGGSDEEMRARFWSCHAYLQPSRGEGWGMMPHQALATGMPVVISDCGGHWDYAWLPGVTLTATTPKPSTLNFHGPSGNWWEPVIGDVVDRCAWVIDTYPDRLAEAQQAPVLCVEHFDWTRLTEQIVDLIGRHVLARPTPKPRWQKPTWKTWTVTALRKVDAQIGDTRIRLAKGEETELRWDARRVLVESGAVV